MADEPIQPQLALSAHNNQSLFSDHYLQEILRRTQFWEQMQSPAAEFLGWLRQLYHKEQNQLVAYNESQLEDNWFKPIFTRLGHVWEGQASIPGLKGSIKKPDFALFPDEAARQTAVAQQNTAAYAHAALAVAEVKQWEINLSKKTGSQPRFDDQNPMYQIDTYLTLTGLEWGILSNGRFWRLIHKNSARTLETYFEVDLLAALNAPNDKAALAIATYFWLFFSQAAYRPDPNGRIFLRDALDQSRAYAVALEADLRDNAYRALEQLIIGFFAGDASLNHHDESHRAQVYQNSLYLLYRLLFLFYGESRALLPMHNPTYKDNYSLQQIAKTIDDQRNQIDSRPTTGRRTWSRLHELCRLISGTDAQLNADLGVPRYNGGLFDPQQHPFLEQHFVGDRALARAIDYLAYRRVREEGQFRGYQAVDYRTLDVRQLGSIYEGLLEYKVAMANEEMVTVRKGGVETWLTAVNRGKDKVLDRRQPGDLYLATDKGERKATGSYYTPDYIVEYIVANTLGPLVAQARERVKLQVRQMALADPAARQQQSAARFVAEILRLNVLDPAMGSGHFLVEATHYLARVLATDEYTQAQKPDFSPKSDFSESTDLLYWKRRVVEACIYGVDKNPMAVELAKLSLWLKTAAADKPLSFLDHHLRHGDSLIGAWLEDLQRAPGSKPQAAVATLQAPLFDESTFTRDVGLAVKGVAVIENLPTDAIDDVYAKEAAWQDIQQTHLERWRRLADLWVSSYFGNATTPEEYRALAAQVQGQPSLISQTQAAQFLTHRAATHNDYCHWQLAFPEVFFDEYGRSRGAVAGFDAVIGNPPYVRQEQLASIKPFLQTCYTTYHSTADLYVYFIELATKSLRSTGLCGLIVSHKFMRADYGLPLRKFLTRRTKLKQIIHFSDLPIFESATAYPAIMQWQKESAKKQLQQLLVAKFTNTDFIQDLSNTVAQVGYYVSQIGLQDSGWTLENGAISQLQQKILQTTLPLIHYVAGKIHYGIKTGLNEAFFITVEKHRQILAVAPQAYSLLKPLAIGEDLQRYRIENQNRFIIVIPAGWTRAQSGLQTEAEAWHWFQAQYPPLAHHLAPFALKAQQRQDKGDFWWELRACDYYHAFESPKIIYPVIAKELRFSLDDEGFYGNDKTFIVPKADKYLLALFNARLTKFFARFALSGLRGDYLEFRASHFQNLPIYAISFTTPAEERTAVLTTAQSHYEQGNHPAILGWADAELAANRNDTLHDLLAFLAQQMINMNKEKQAALEACWLDLEGVTEAKPFALLRHKGKHAHALYKTIPAARPFVNEASHSTITLETSLNWNEEAFKGFVKALAGPVSNLSKLVQVYRSHAPGVAALTQRLAATDHLIDQAVYKLYGLTAAEIAIVEAASI